MEWKRNEYWITDDAHKANLNVIHRLLSTSYWAATRSRETIQKTIERSLCFSLYKQDVQIGFARVVTDFATVGWLGDVIIDLAYRGQGLGKWLVETIVSDERLKSLALILSTRDAHTLYAQYGFRKEPDKLMWKPRPQ
jgi:N-acetylglutamate synthase-like GNAT family acetyltransferase